MLNKKTFLLIALFFSVIILSGCSFVRVQNVSESEITVSVNVPDSGKSYTRNIEAGNIVDVFSANGGRYSVTMLPSERYRESLMNLQQLISARLFQDGATLTSAEVAQLVENMNSIDQLIAELENPMASCSGYVPDFETAVVTVIYDGSGSDYAMECSNGGN